jgi:predicted  nucleic acid-binding Zn-ribbon protein
MRSGRTGIGVAIVVLILGAAAAMRASAQPPNTSDPLPALLAEVHALRVAMEQQASIGPRVQLTMARLNIEEQRVTHLSAEVDNVRQRLMGLDNGITATSDRLATLQQQLQIESDPNRRRQLEAEAAEAQRVVRMQATEQQAMRSRESEAAQALASEQARWVELNSRLDELERLLTPVR